MKKLVVGSLILLFFLAGPSTFAGDCSRWATANQFPENYEIYGVTWVGDRFLMYGRHGDTRVLYYSMDGETWTLVPMNISFRDIAGNGETFVGLDGGYIYASHDLVNWSRRPTTPFYGSYRKVTWARNQFRVVGEDETHVTSASGFSWSRVFTPSTVEHYDVGGSEQRALLTTFTGVFHYYRPQFGNWRSRWLGDFSYKLYCPVTNDQVDVALARFSGQPYEIVTIGENEQVHKWALDTGEVLKGATWTGSRFLVSAAGGASPLYTSTDGLGWTPHPTLNGDLNGVAAGNGRVVACGPGGRLILSEDDGETWRDIDFLNLNALRDVTQGPNGMVAVSESGRILHSYRGSTWSTITGLRGDTTYSAVAASEEIYVAVASANQGIWTSGDGFKWRRRLAPAVGDLTSVCYGDTGFLATSSRGEVIVSADGVNWSLTAATDPVYHASTTDGLDYLLAGEDGWVAVTPDGVTLQQTQIAPGFHINGIAADGMGIRVAVGRDGLIYRYSDATGWQAADSGVDDHLMDVHWDGFEFLAVGQNILTSADGMVWEVSRDDTGQLHALADNGSSTVAVGAKHRIWLRSCTSCNPPSISDTWNTRHRISPGENLQLTAPASGTAPLQYQWRFNGEPLVGKTQNTLSIPNLTEEDTGVYTCQITNPCGSMITPDAFLRVTGEVTPLSQSEDVSACDGDPIRIETIAAGTTQYNSQFFHWRKDGAYLFGQNDYVLQIDVTPETVGVYDNELYSFGDIQPTNPTTVSLIQPPSVISGPSDAKVCLGDTALFQASVDDLSAPIQWYKDGEILLGETGNTLVIPDVNETDAGSYQCRAFYPCGSTESQIATLNVGDVTETTIYPAFAVKGVGPATFDAFRACSFENPQYQWLDMNSGEILPETGSRLQVTDPGQGLTTYQVTITNPADGEEAVAYTTLLAGFAGYWDVNNDLCNSIEDLHLLASQWREPGLYGPDGVPELTILDMLYINTSGNCVNP